jgi:hypothetical protein
MSRTGPEAVERYRRRIKGRSGGIANPFRYKGQSPSPPTTATAVIPGFEVPLLMEDVPGTGKPDPQVLPQIIVRDALGKQHAVPLPDGLEDDRAGPWLRTAIEQRGLTSCKLEALICDKAEAIIGDVEHGGELPIWIRKALLHVFGDPRGVQHYTRDGGAPGSTRLDVTLGISLEYARALAKLAFHYALKQLPWLDGHDAAFTPIKQFILDGKGNWNDYLDFSAPTFLLAPPGERPTDGHFLMLNVGQKSITVFLKTFAGSAYSHDAVRVNLGATPTSAFRFPVLGHHLRLFVGGPQQGHDGEMISLRTFFLRDRWGVLIPLG